MPATAVTRRQGQDKDGHEVGEGAGCGFADFNDRGRANHGESKTYL
eukprot:gene15277-20580_t